MSFNKAHQMVSKQSDVNEKIQDEVNRQIRNRDKETTDQCKEDCYQPKQSSGSSRWPRSVSPKRQMTQDCVVRVYKAAETNPALKGKEVPRFFQNTASDRIQNAYKRTVAQAYARKPGVTVKKPKLDYPGEADCIHPWVFGEDQATSVKDQTRIDKKNFTEESFVECGGAISTDSVELENDDSSGLLNCQYDETTTGEDIKEGKKVEFRKDYFIDDANVDKDSGYDGNVGNSNEEDVDVIPHVVTKCPLNKNKTPRTNTTQRNIRKEGLPEHQDFVSSITNTIHSCIKKKIPSSPSLSDTGNLKPANKQLEDSKAKSLIKLIDSGPEGVDLKLSVFMSACAHDPRTLQPFPDTILIDNDINRHLLYYIAEEIPSVNMISFFLKENEPVPLRKELIPVVDWLIRNEDPRLELLQEPEKKELLGRVSNVPLDIMPSKIFRLKTKRNSELEQFWQNVKGDNETVFAYHNCKVEDAHSVLYYGLHNHLTKNGVFGPGIYLTNNLSFCVDTCPSGSTWGKSSLGTKLKLVFVAEFISNHNVLSYSGHGIPYQTDKLKNEANSSDRYYFIKKPNLIRLRYVMVYIVEPSTLPKNPFSYAPIRRKLIKYLGIFRISLLIATIFMGATASQRKIQPTTWIVETVQNCYQKFSTDFLHWPIWKYVETPYLVVPLMDTVPQSCSNSF